MSERATRFWLVLTLLLAAALPEVWLGNLGFLIPLTAPLIVYFTLAYGWECGIVAALAGGGVQDLLYGRDFPLAAAALLLLVLTAWYFRRGGIYDLPDLLIPATVSCGVAETVWAVGAAARSAWDREEIVTLLAQAFWLTALGVGGVLVWCMALDLLAGKLGLPTGIRPRPSRPSRRRWPTVGGK